MSSAAEARYAEVVEISPLIRRVLARNANPFTFKGTGTYIVGRGKVAVIDPGPLIDEHVDALKAALNGVPNLSISDGWWWEGYNGGNGWTIGPTDPLGEIENRDVHDADLLYSLLETEIVPLFYQRDSDGVPRGWMHVVKSSIASIAPLFSARRMVKEYVERMYAPALERSRNSGI